MLNTNRMREIVNGPVINAVLAVLFAEGQFHVDFCG